ncbi:MAG: hypothetical protein NTX01_08335 [Candidatus Omnitrophica bacterium]|nr:hypothetical protein [Candidatus Omnitrophota bacterium]MCX5699690.1 hypothetical protein [Candidatus Omnitrophota bacterium]
MDNQNQPKWYFKTWSLVASFLCIGPFMLPLVWANPRFSKKSKIIITVGVLIITYVLTELLVKSLKTISSYYQVPLEI